VVILTLGGKHGTASIASMGEGVDATNINLPARQEDLIVKLARLGKPTVGIIHLDGRPVSSDAADAHLWALLEAWSPAEAGAQAIVDVLTGTYGPSGRLPVSIARNAGQVPIYYNHPNGSAWHQGESMGFPDYVDAPHTPRYPFGYGLTYTHFDYQNLSLSLRQVESNDTIEVACTVSNTGDRPGTEIVQLYVSDRYASMSTPVLELAGFQRVDLEPGAITRVSFALRVSQLAYLDADMCWRVEAGEVDVMIGASSGDLRLTDTVRVGPTHLSTDRAALSGPRQESTTRLIDLVDWLTNFRASSSLITASSCRTTPTARSLPECCGACRICDTTPRPH
jgi:beta-glucosidase